MRAGVPERSPRRTAASRTRPCQFDTVRPCGAVSSDPIAAAAVASGLAGSCGIHSSYAAAAAARAAAVDDDGIRAAVAAAVINSTPTTASPGGYGGRVLTAAAAGAAAASSMDEQHTLNKAIRSLHDQVVSRVY